MGVFDAIALVVLFIVGVLFVAILARQRFMLRGVGGIPLALRSETKRWLYGVAQYNGDELRWYRAMGIGTRPSRSMRRDELEVLEQRAPLPQEEGALPPRAVVVECRDGHGEIGLAFGDDSVTGFRSWLEAATPRW